MIANIYSIVNDKLERFVGMCTIRGHCVIIMKYVVGVVNGVRNKYSPSGRYYC